MIKYYTPHTKKGRAIRTVNWFLYGKPYLYDYDHMKLKDIIPVKLKDIIPVIIT